MKVPLLFAALVLGSSTARADDELQACLDDAVAILERSGVTEEGERVVGFLSEGEQRSLSYTLPEDGCVGFLAVGHQMVQDLDLVLYTDTGIALENDVERDAHPYVRYCGAAGLTLVASVRMYKGRGEYQLARLRDAPPTLPDLNRAVGSCFATVGGLHRPPADVGPPPPSHSLDEAVAHMNRELSELGYAPVGTTERAPLRPRERRLHRVHLDAGRCYAILALGAGGVRDLDLTLRSADGREIARDDGRFSDALVRTCPPASGPYDAEVRMFDGAGEYALSTYRLSEPTQLPRGIDGTARMAWAELTVRFAARGLSPRIAGWGFAWPGRPVAFPIRLDAGRCYALAAIPTDSVARGDLDLVLLSQDGDLLAWDLGRGSTPVVYRCPEVTEIHRVVGRVYGARGRFAVVVGEETGGTP